MSRRRLIIFVTLLAIFLVASPVSAATSEYLNYTEDYVDNNTSDVDSSADKGTHSNFANQQSYDSTYDTLTEENTGGAGSDTEDFVDQLGTSHTPSDIGTHTDWTELQDEDDTYDTLTEGDTGGAGVDEDIYVDTAPSAIWTQTGASPYIDEGLSDGNYISTSSNGLISGWYNFASTTASGSGCTVVIYVWVGQSDDDDCDWQVDWTGDGTADASGTWTDPTGAYYNTGTLSGCDTDTEINQMQIRFTFSKGGGSPTTMTIDEAYANVVQAGGSNYDLDLELGWTNAPYTEDNVYLCIDTGAFSGESLQVDVWDEVSTNDWVNLDTTVTASDWNNYSISAYINSGTVLTLFESFAVTEQISNSISYSLILYEEMTILDSITHFRVIQLMLYESVTFSEEIITSAAFSAVLYESFAISERVSNASTFSLTLYESFTIDESIENTLLGQVYYLNLNETVGINDTYSTSAAFMLILNESVNIVCDYEAIFGGTWILNLDESFTLIENDVWAPYRPVATPTTTTITEEPRPRGLIEFLVYYQYSFLAIALGALSLGVMFYIDSSKPKKKVKGTSELKLKSGARMISHKLGETKERLSSAMPTITIKDKDRKRTVKKRKKKGKTVVRKRSGKPRGRQYTGKKKET